jgi:REP element-mobilizing transposase RayT
MSHSLTKLLFHVVFRTKHDRPFLQGEVDDKLNGYLAGIADNHDAHLIRAGGVADHRHVLLELKPTTNVADVVRLLKANSSRWIHQSYTDLRDFGWQVGYAAFSVSVSAQDDVVRYIDNQAERHRKSTFEEELRLLCQRHGVDYDPTVWEE